jgi:hypothetical protein
LGKVFHQNGAGGGGGDNNNNNNNNNNERVSDIDGSAYRGMEDDVIVP